MAIEKDPGPGTDERPLFPATSVDRESPLSWEKRGADERAFRNVFRETIRAFEEEGIPYVLGGGIASSLLGRPRHTLDIDLFVKHSDASRALAALDARGYRTQETNPFWIYKAVKGDVLVDIIFRSKGDLYVDDDVLHRARDEEFEGTKVKVIPPEDLIVIKAIVHTEEIPHHWHDCLGVISRCSIDWPYLLTRARLGARRVLSLLVYAQSNDVAVPDEVIWELIEMVYGTAEHAMDSAPEG